MRHAWHGPTLLAALSAALALLAGCTPSPPSPRALDAAFMKAVTSPIPGAHATLYPGAGAVTLSPDPAAACVTEAGYCSLERPTPDGLNCLCDTGQLSYGGRTGRPPATIDQR